MEGIEDLFRERLVETTEGYFTCSRGKKLFTRTWTPTKANPKAIICILHGFGSNISWLYQKTALLFTDAGFAVAGLDAQGFGRSEGLDGYIPKFDDLVSDAGEYFNSVRSSERYRHLPPFLYGESMGGAIALLLSLQEPRQWAGAVICAPMVKIVDSARPPWIVMQLVHLLVHVIPTWPIVPAGGSIESCFRDLEIAELEKQDPFLYTKKVRLKTMEELLRVVLDLQTRLHEVTIPFLVCHGTADVVTNIEGSKTLYEQASSLNKIFKAYADGCHALLQGEPQEQRRQIAKDIVDWFDQRVATFGKTAAEGALREAEKVDRIVERA